MNNQPDAADEYIRISIFFFLIGIGVTFWKFGAITGVIVATISGGLVFMMTGMTSIIADKLDKK